MPTVWMTLPVLATLLIGAPIPAAADYDFFLRDGGRLHARVYEVRGEKLTLFQGQGAIEVDRASVERIVAVGAAEDHEETAVIVPGPPSPAPKATDEAATPAKPDPAVTEREMTRRIILANRELLFAENRGENAESLAARKREITKLERARSAVRARPAPAR